MIIKSIDDVLIVVIAFIVAVSCGVLFQVKRIINTLEAVRGHFPGCASFQHLLTQIFSRVRPPIAEARFGWDAVITWFRMCNGSSLIVSDNLLVR
jgi:hypothetical protein